MVKKGQAYQVFKSARGVGVKVVVRFHRLVFNIGWNWIGGGVGKI
jgi:hypothetical protein